MNKIMNSCVAFLNQQKSDREEERKSSVRTSGFGILSDLNWNFSINSHIIYIYIIHIYLLYFCILTSRDALNRKAHGCLMPTE